MVNTNTTIQKQRRPSSDQQCIEIRYCRTSFIIHLLISERDIPKRVTMTAILAGLWWSRHVGHLYSDFAKLSTRLKRIVNFMVILFRLDLCTSVLLCSVVYLPLG